MIVGVGASLYVRIMATGNIRRITTFGVIPYIHLLLKKEEGGRAICLPKGPLKRCWSVVAPGDQSPEQLPGQPP